MGETTALLGRCTAVVAGSLLALTLLASVVGEVWHVTMWGLMHGTGPGTLVHPRVIPGPGFEFGFGIPLTTAILWLFPLAVLFGLGYLAFEVTRRPGTAGDATAGERRTTDRDPDGEEYGKTT